MRVFVAGSERAVVVWWDVVSFGSRSCSSNFLISRFSGPCGELVKRRALGAAADSLCKLVPSMSKRSFVGEA